VEKGFKVWPPTSKKNRPPGRQKKNRYPAPSEKKGKATRQVVCPSYGEHGHRRGSWRCHLTGTKKRKRTKKSALKPGRKKSKKSDPTPSGANTLRTRAVVAREQAARAAMEAEQAAAKADAVAKAAAAAKRDAQVEAPEPSTPPRARSYTKLHKHRLLSQFCISNTMFFNYRNFCHALQIVGDLENLPPLAVVHPLAVEPPAPKKFTPLRKQLATKIKKMPEKHTARGKIILFWHLLSFVNNLWFVVLVA
jgi:hypothetical protein